MEFKDANGCDSKINTFTTIAAGVVIVREGKVLLSKEKGHDLWKFPGGCIRDHENMIQVAKRETEEETGLRVKIDDKTEPVLFSFHREEPDGLRYYTLIHYKAIGYEGDLYKGAEELNFFDIDKLPEVIGPNIRPVLTQMGYMN